MIAELYVLSGETAQRVLYLRYYHVEFISLYVFLDQTLLPRAITPTLKYV